MTVMCERDTTKPGNHCVKCGSEWMAGTPLPACSAVMGTGYGLAAFKADPQPPLVEPLRCDPKPDGSHGKAAPLCPRDGVTASFLPLDGRTYTKDEIIESSGLTQSWQVPSAVLLDPVVRDLARDEPFFILRGSDLLADYLVELWARNAEAQGCDAKRVQAARMKAAEMKKFSPRRYPV